MYSISCLSRTAHRGQQGYTLALWEEIFPKSRDLWTSWDEIVCTSLVSLGYWAEGFVNGSSRWLSLCVPDDLHAPSTMLNSMPEYEKAGLPTFLLERELIESGNSSSAAQACTMQTPAVARNSEAGTGSWWVVQACISAQGGNRMFWCWTGRSQFVQFVAKTQPCKG